MNIFLWLIIICICLVIFKSLADFIQGDKVGFRMNLKESRFSVEIFYALVIIYSIVIIGFGLIYFILSFQGVILVEYDEMHHPGIIGSLIHSLYFSGVTLFTIGYGDIVPIGIGRLIALIQALLGYVLPTTFVLRIVTSNQK